MYYGDYGNYDPSISRTYNLYQATNSKSMSQEPEKLLPFYKSVDKSASVPHKRNMPKVTVELPLSEDTKAMVINYTTPEQSARISSIILQYFK